MAVAIEPSKANIDALQQALTEQRSVQMQMALVNTRIELITEKMLREAGITNIDAVVNIKQGLNEFEVKEK
jgi:hypothetical protein